MPILRQGLNRTVGVSLTVLIVACGALSGPKGTPSTSSSPPVAFDFAGVNTKANVQEVDGLRATMTWTVPPRLLPGYSVSTWIAFAAPTDGHGVSQRIAQVGWIEIDPGDPHVFWEWATSSSDSHRQIGRAVQRGLPLKVEIDRDSNSGFTFYADDVVLGTTSVPWTPTAVGAFAETHVSSEYLPGSASQPEIISRFEEKVGGRWVPYAGQVLTTSSQFRVTVSTDNAVRIWDVRQSSPP